MVPSKDDISSVMYEVLDTLYIKYLSLSYNVSNICFSWFLTDSFMIRFQHVLVVNWVPVKNSLNMFSRCICINFC